MMETIVLKTGKKNSDLPRILIVDDEPRILRSLEAALKDKFDVSLAQDAIKAQEILKRTEHFDVIVSDDHMPKLSGHEFLKWTKDNHPHSVRIMLTSSDISKLQELNKSVDVYMCLPKPWNNQKLREILDQAVLRSRALVTHAEKNPPSTTASRQCAMAVLDMGETDADSYQLIGQNIEGISATHFFDSTDQVISALREKLGIGVCLIDLSIGNETAANLISDLNKNYASVSIIVTAKPAAIRDFLQTFEKSHNFQYIVKPMSLKRIQPIVLSAVEKHLAKSTKKKRST